MSKKKKQICSLSTDWDSTYLSIDSLARPIANGWGGSFLCKPSYQVRFLYVFTPGLYLAGRVHFCRGPSPVVSLTAARSHFHPFSFISIAPAKGQRWAAQAAESWRWFRRIVSPHYQIEGTEMWGTANRPQSVILVGGSNSWYGVFQR